jgi:hypothetical protein
MTHAYALPLTMLRGSLVSALAGVGLIAAAQTVIVPQSVTASLDPFSSVTAASNMTLNITAATTASTTFPYSPSSNFSTGIGYVSDYGEDVGSITYVFSNPVSISRMLIWNAYFDFELDHSLRNVQLVFRNAANGVIATNNLSLPMATENNLTAHVANLPSEVIGVKRVEINVSTLWGGNELSVRRIAFAGNGLTTGMEEASITESPLVFPLPATDIVTVMLPGIRSLVLLDGLGREVPAEVNFLADRADVSVEGLPAGLYHAVGTTSRGRFSAKVVVSGE